MFVDGEYFDKVIATPQGPVRVLADIHVFGRHVVLDGFLFYPEEGERLEIGVSQVLSIKRKLSKEAKAEGFAEITTVYNRQGKGRNQRTIVHTRSLE